MRQISKSFVRKSEIGFRNTKLERRRVLNGATLEVETGEIVCIVGKNGSGKTTLVRILSTLITPDSGLATVCGFNTVDQPDEVKKCIGVMLNSGEGGFHARLSAFANLEYYAALYKIPRNHARQRASAILRDLDLEDRGADQVQSYSTGMRRRVALSRALLPDTPVLLLDEPTLGVDPWSSERIHKYLEEIASRGKTILLTTNNPTEANAIGDRCLMVNEGALHPFRIEEALAA